MLAKAEVDPTTLDGHAGDERIPLVAPGVTVLVGVEDGHEAGGRHEGLHEGDILAAVVARGVVAAVGAEPVGLLGHGHGVVDARLAVGVDADLHAERLGDVDGDVDEADGGDDLLVFLYKAGVGLLEPGGDGAVDPAGLLDEGAVGLELLVVEAAAAVEEPDEELGGAVAAAAVGAVDGEIVV